MLLAFLKNMDAKPDYNLIGDESVTEVDEESWPLTEGGTENNNKRQKTLFYRPTLPWIISTFSLLTLAIFLLARESLSDNQTHCQDGRLSQYEFGPSRSAVKTKVVKFTSGLIYDEGGKLVRTHDPNEIDWVGTPTDEMDEAWDDLTLPQDLFATEEEVREANLGAEEYLIPEFGLYHVEFEVFHGLHCLNLLRKTLYISYYPEFNTETLMTHADHCIDALRQLLMCTGDLTPIPIVWSSTKHRRMPDFENTHLCRDFGALKEWASTRDADSPELRDKNARRMNGTRA